MTPNLSFVSQSLSTGRIGRFFLQLVVPVALFAVCMAPSRSCAQLIANFSADDTAGCAPLVVNFTNTSSGATSYDWNLGNGEVSAFSNALGTYGTAGTYTVTLVAHNGTSNSTATMIIRVYAPPTVLFTASDTAPCPYSPVTFTSTTIPGSWGALTYNWNFGDGYSSAATSPVHSYATPGYYNVTLFATNGKGCINSLTHTSYIHVRTPAAIGFNAPTTYFCKAPATASFVNTTAGVAPLTYKWDFGDGATSTLTSPSHTYTTAGTAYTVKLIATDGKGCKDTLILPNYITIGNLHAAFTSVPLACGATPVTFNNTSSSHISSQWFFGDGGSSSADVGVHNYSAPGTFTVKLVVFDGTCYDTVTHPITISYPVGGNFNIVPAVPCFPITAPLAFNGTGPAGTTISWVFDDGTTATGPSVTHLYNLARIYTTSMIVTNSSGCKDTVTKLDTLFNLNINPTATAGSGCIPLTTSFSSYAYSVVTDPFTLTSQFFSYPLPCTSYTWNFGDGSPTSSSPTPTHIYTATGAFTVSCHMVMSNGCSNTATTTVKAGSLQTASFTRTPTRLCANHAVAFHSTSTSTSLIDMYNWSYGDGGSDQGASTTNPIHTYTAYGIQNVSLTVEFNGCVSDPFSRPDTVDSPGGNIFLTYDCTPANGITFVDSNNADFSHLWMFGDGTTSTGHRVDHLYPILSSYAVTLATYSPATGCRDTNVVSVNLAKPVFHFIVADTALCLGQKDTITCDVTVRTASTYAWYDNGILRDTSGNIFSDSFATPGLHNIVTVIKDGYGCRDTSQIFHILAAHPVDSFNFSPPTGCGPLSVAFTDHSTDVTGAVISSYTWTFGDGTPDLSGSFPTPAHIYSMQGNFTVRETITDNAGCSNTFTSSSVVTVHRPVASFSVSTSAACAGVGIVFTNTSTGITGSLWMFGDGATSTLNSPTHSYAVSGVYSVKLVVYDTYGCVSDTLNMPGLITTYFSPHAAFTMSDSFAVCPPLHVTDTNMSTGAVSYLWLFGDGTSSVSPSTASDVYITPGLYHVKLIATATNGCTDTATRNVSLFGYAGAFSYTPTSGCAPLNSRFVALVASVDSFFWDYGDGGGFAGIHADTIYHTYHSPGNYLPKLVLRDSFGCTTFSYGADTIRVDTVVADFSVTPGIACQNSPLTFHDLSVSGSSYPMTSWLWSFGSGATSTLSTPTYTYSVAGVHSVTLTATSAGGCAGTVTHTFTVNPAPAAIAGLSVMCQGTSSLFSDITTPGSWSSSNAVIASVGTGTGMVAANSVGTATITYTSGPGCPATRPVTVVASPAAISGASAFCITLPSTYTDSTPGGIWSITPTTVATVSPTGVVTGTGGGTATLSYTLGACSATKTIVISGLPSPISGPATVCVGQVITLSDLPSGGTWSASGSHATVGSTGVVTGVSPGTSVITYSLGAGCTQNKTITVNPLSQIVGPTGVCVGGTFTLTDSISGGTWSSSNPLVATVGSSSGTIAGILAGTVTIYYALPTGCTATHPVTVHGLPSPIGGSHIVCQNAVDTLTDTAGGGTWTAVPATIGSIDPLTGVLTGILSGTVGVTYSLGGTGCQANTTITINSAPAVIGGTPHVCAGATTTLTDVTIPGTWSTTSTFASVGSSSGTVSGSSAGIATITYTGTINGCRRTADVTVNPLPTGVSGPTSVCIAVSVTLTDSLSPVTWSSSNPAVGTVGATTGVVTGISAGTFIITCTSPAGCQAERTMSVNGAPAAITGPSVICVGANALLSDPTPGGGWVASNANATVGGSGLLHGVTPGYDTITYSLGPGCSVSHNVTVIALPASITGVNHMCAGASTTLSDPTSDGIWYSSNPFISVVDSFTGTVTGVASGVANIYYSLGPSCNAVMPVTINPTPAAIGGPSYVCLGQTATMTETTPSGTWYSTVPTVAPISSTGVVLGAASGSTVISYTIANGCMATKTVSVIQVPAITGLAGNHCSWRDTFFVNDPLPGGVYTSIYATVSTLPGGNGEVFTHAPGTCTITYTMPTGCSYTTTFTVNPLPEIITGSLHACVGLTTILSDATPGGLWSSTGGAFSVGSSTGIVNGISSGTGMVTYTLPATGCHIDTMITIGGQPSAVIGPTGVCVGGSVTLSDTAFGGNWTSSSPSVASVGSITGIVSGVSAGVATLTYSMDPWCSVARSFTVNPLPDVFTTIGGGAFCFGGAGMHIYLSGSQPGVNYQLYNGPTPVGLPVTGSGTSLDFGAQPGAGTYSVTATYPATTCSKPMAGSAAITVNPAPTAFSLTGGGPYCAGTAGAHIGLTSSLAGTNYRLYLGGSPVGTLVPGTGAALDFGIFSTAGSYKAFATNLLTTCTGYMADSVSLTITPNVVPSVSIAVTPSDTVCAGTPVTLTATPVNGGLSPAYQWRVNGAGGGTGPSYTYSPANGDAVTAKLTSNANCALPDTARASVSITVDAQLIPVVTLVTFPAPMLLPFQNDTLIAFVTGAGPSPTYQWYKNGMLVPGANSDTFIVVNVANNDSVRCVVTSTGMCGGNSGNKSVTFIVNTVGVQQLGGQGKLTVVPNPNKGTFTLKGSVSSVDEEVLVELTNMLGQVVYKTKVTARNGILDERIQPDGELANGVYLLNVNAQRMNGTFHIVIER